MLCEHCKQRKATVTVTQIINGQKSEKHYCEVCAAQFHPFSLDFPKEEQIPIHQLFSNWFGIPIWKNDLSERTVQPSVQTSACPACGFTFRKFLNEGKLGCPQCYETFSEKLPQVLAKIQAGTKHTGKRPGQKTDNNRLLKKQIERAREQLQLAIQDERFEDAAKYRDEIKELERKLEMGGVDTP
ncbi:UvrB/UvrC motif-containing protein [Ureibacillus sp. FSL K6-8385]|uniref:Nucleotide excision repair protein n=1 Tax=Ureibacillus terrenus TaxID=118246 RepID=A0A540V2Q8_9BACL|nr:UvrB/UvrC motif-containing protein [Ureibacillus terrenus]MED3661675.1 UvrB/UvrC motif-containing protein [Ureibacillus terrenus]MED3763543.1 UvrB/UvrC motif-containing protein [Ureibacillus terrenus]TQE91032.1 nucleotide excision repair protein [Ureibacillus terrenus]